MAKMNNIIVTPNDMDFEEKYIAGHICIFCNMQIVRNASIRIKNLFEFIFKNFNVPTTIN